MEKLQTRSRRRAKSNADGPGTPPTLEPPRQPTWEEFEAVAQWPTLEEIQAVTRGESGEERTPNPWADLPYGGDFAYDGALELDALSEAFARAAPEPGREPYFCLVLLSRAQKEMFLIQAQIEQPPDTRWIDGVALAKKLGIKLPKGKKRGQTKK